MKHHFIRDKRAPKMLWKYLIPVCGANVYHAFRTNNEEDFKKLMRKGDACNHCSKIMDF